MDRTITTRSLVVERSRSKDRAAHQQLGLHSIESALAKARTEAELLDEPVLAYFVDMAIHEVRSRLTQEASSVRRDGKTADVVQLRDWFPKDD
jgi:hypothetical protein